jgi:hypothetical protein
MESFDDVQDHGAWLSFSMTHAGTKVAVRVSREAMEEHFGAGQGPDTLKQAYALDAEMIHARAADQIVAGVAYTQDHPLMLGMADF